MLPGLIFLSVTFLVVGILLGVYAPKAWNAAVRAACAKLVAEEQAIGGDLASLLSRLRKPKPLLPPARALTPPAPAPAPAPTPTPTPAPEPAPLQPAPIAPGLAG